MSTENADQPFDSALPDTQLPNTQPSTAQPPDTQPPPAPVMPPPMAQPLVSRPLATQPPAIQPQIVPILPITLPPTLPPMMAKPLAPTEPQPPYFPYAPSAPIAPYASYAAAPPYPQARRGSGDILRVVGVILVTLVVIGVAASTMPGSVARARTIAYPVPNVSITIPQSSGPIVVGTDTQFVAQVKAGNDLSFTWDFGDGSGAVGAQVNHTYSDYGNGAYTVILQAVDPIGQQATSQLQVNVAPEKPTASFTASVPDPTNPLTVQFDASNSTATQPSCTWDFGDTGSDSSGDCQTSHQYQQVGTYTVTLTVTDIANQTATSSQQVTVSIPKPVALFTPAVDPNDSYCVNVDASNSSGYQLSYSWDFGDGYGSGFGSSTGYCYSNPGTYTITLTVIDGLNTSATARHSVTVGQ